MNKAACLVLLLCVLLSAVGTSWGSDTTGTSAGQFLKITAGARASAMGDAFAAVSDDASAVFWNPAGIAGREEGMATLTHAIWLKDIASDWASVVQPTTIGAFGAGMQYVNYGNIQSYDEFGTPGKTLSPNDRLIVLTYANHIKGLMLGASLKQVSSTLNHSASTVTGDFGMKVTMLRGRLSAGAVLQNTGGSLKYTTVEEPLPQNLKVGLAMRIGESWLAAADMNMPNDGDAYYCGGVENVNLLSDSFRVMERAGYTTRIKGMDDGFTGFTAGLGIDFLGYCLDYVFAPYGSLGYTHRISFSITY